MASTYKVLAQSAPSATTNTDLYTVAASTSAIISTLMVCNRGASSTTYRVAVRPAGAGISNTHYIVYDATIAANSSTAITIGASLATTDVITVYVGAAQVSFTAFGVELT